MRVDGVHERTAFATNATSASIRIVARAATAYVVELWIDEPLRRADDR